MAVFGAHLPRRLEKDLAAIEGATLLRRATVRGEAIVASEKLDEIDFLAWKSMGGQAMLTGWENQLAADNPILADELRSFRETARLAKLEIMLDVLHGFRQM